MVTSDYIVFIFDLHPAASRTVFWVICIHSHSTQAEVWHVNPLLNPAMANPLYWTLPRVVIPPQCSCLITRLSGTVVRSMPDGDNYFSYRRWHMQSDMPQHGDGGIIIMIPDVVFLVVWPWGCAYMFGCVGRLETQLTEYLESGRHSQPCSIWWDAGLPRRQAWRQARIHRCISDWVLVNAWYSIWCIKSASAITPSVPKVKTNSGEKAFHLCAPFLWKIPPPLFVRSANSVAIFRKRLKAHLFDLPLSSINISMPDGSFKLWNCFIDFAVEHWFRCWATEPGYTGCIGTMIWLID